MNLAEPPEVHDLTPARTEQLRAALVSRASGGQAPQHPRRAWVPVVAAGTGVAVVAAIGAVLLPWSGERQAASPAAPVASSPTAARVGGEWPSSRRPTVALATPLYSIPQWVAPPSGQVSLVAGPATEAAVRSTLRRCFTAPGQQYFRPEDADTAIIEWARWFRRPVVGPDPADPRGAGRHLVVSVLRADRHAWATCVDDPRSPSGFRLDRGGESHPSAPPGRPNTATVGNPVVTAGVGGGGTHGDGRWVLTWYSSLEVTRRVAHAEFRIAWLGGASNWHAAYVAEGTGYVEVAAVGRGIRPANHRIEFRLFDRSGRVFHNAEGYRNGLTGYP